MSQRYADKSIDSYGIILFYKDKDQIWYLISQRRDTIEYSAFIRGIYPQSYLETYFKLMTPEEHERLKYYTFDELWNDLWINHDTYLYESAKRRAKTRYIENFELMNKLLETTYSTVNEPIWGFPKGRKNFMETDLECAFREFSEETKMVIHYHNILHLAPSEEIFYGSDNKLYRTIYYIAQIDLKLPICKIQLNNNIRTETISDEISNLMWGTLETSIKKLSPRRQRLLIDTEYRIKHYLYTHTSHFTI